MREKEPKNISAAIATPAAKRIAPPGTERPGDRCAIARNAGPNQLPFARSDIITIYANENCLTDGIPDIKKINPFLLTMPDNRFWSIGEGVGNAWHDGREILKKISRTRELD